MATPDDMIARIEAGYRKTAAWTGLPAPSAAVLAAMRRVPREAFVRAEDRGAAYENRPLPIGHGQTISQPYIVALMADLARPTPRSRVLEIGAGCGYAAAVLACLAAEVHTIECVAALADGATETLARLGFDGVEVHHGDGVAGWPAAAPFDAIVVSAAARDVPEALLRQLARPGVLVAPVGPAGGRQTLVRIERDRDGAWTREEILPVAFVPLVRP